MSKVGIHSNEGGTWKAQKEIVGQLQTDKTKGAEGATLSSRPSNLDIYTSQIAKNISPSI